MASGSGGPADSAGAEPLAEGLGDAAEALAQKLLRSRRPLLLFDLPAARWNAVGTIQQFCAALDIPFGCTVPAVHQLGRPSTQFLGILPSVDVERQAIYDAADLVITCGLTISDVTTGGFVLDLAGREIAKLSPSHTQLEVDGRPDPAVYYGAGLVDVLAATLSKVSAAFGERNRWWRKPTQPGSVERPLRDDDAISEQYFFSRLQSFVRADDVLIAETGTSGQNTVGLDLPVPLRYINQSSWGSIGYALPALLGACAASPERRHILCTGDGSFQVTVQELSTIIRCGFAPVVFLLNNRGYTIERAILGRHSDYNDVVNWTYVDVPRVFGIDEDNYLSRVCETRSGLESALRDAADAKSLAFIEVQLEALDMPPATAAVGDFTRRFDYGEYGPANK